MDAPEGNGDGPDAKRPRKDEIPTLRDNKVPSIVVHIRNLNPRVTEADILRVLSRFGQISYVKTVPDRGMALVEFEELNGARACIIHAQKNQIFVAGLPAQFDYSIKKKIDRVGLESEIPNYVIIITVYNVQFPVTLNAIHTVCKAHGYVSKIVFLRRPTIQLLVEFDSVDSAHKAKHGLNGAYMYAGCNILHVEFAKQDVEVNVPRNNQNTWDFNVDPNLPQLDPPPQPLPGGRGYGRDAEEEEERANSMIQSGPLLGGNNMGPPNSGPPGPHQGGMGPLYYEHTLYRRSLMDDRDHMRMTDSRYHPYNNYDYMRDREREEHLRDRRTDEYMRYPYPYRNAVTDRRTEEYMRHYSYYSDRIDLRSMNQGGGYGGGYYPQSYKSPETASAATVQYPQYPHYQSAGGAAGGGGSAGFASAYTGSYSTGSSANPDRKPYEAVIEAYAAGLGASMMNRSAGGYDNGFGGRGGPMPDEQPVVMMIYGLEGGKINCEKMFNLLCLYGNVNKVKFMASKPDCAMVEMGSQEQMNNAINFLHMVELYGNKLKLMPSKQSVLHEIQSPYELPDGTPSFKDYTDFLNARNHRFSNPETRHRNKLMRPTSVLHYFNAPPQFTEEDLIETFQKGGALYRPNKIVIFPSKSQRSSSGIAEFDDTNGSLDALLKCNHIPVHAPNYKAPFVMRLAFSPKNERGQPSANVTQAQWGMHQQGMPPQMHPGM